MRVPIELILVPVYSSLLLQSPMVYSVRKYGLHGCPWTASIFIRT